MSLKITSITRVNPSPCMHFDITVDDNGVIRNKILSLDEFNKLLDTFTGFPGGARGALAMAWAVDRRARGATLAQLVNVEIESTI